MEALGLALIVGGAAFFCSGLIFLIPERRISADTSFLENLDEIESNLQYSRNERGEY